jgi:hypothetical protein
MKNQNLVTTNYLDYLKEGISKESWADDFLKILDNTSVSEKLLFSDVKMMIDFISDLLKIKHSKYCIQAMCKGECKK